MDLGVISPNKKRIRSLPITIDILDNNLASIVPYIDGKAYPELIIQNEVKDFPKTHIYQFVTDVVGIDVALVIHGCCIFELYRINQPVGVQFLPLASRFSQVGIQEFFRYGKIKSFILRVIVFGGTEIPFTLYFADQ